MSFPSPLYSSPILFPLSPHLGCLGEIVHAGGDSINNDDIQIVLHEREVGDRLGARLGVWSVAGRQGPYEGVGCTGRLPDEAILIKRLKVVTNEKIGGSGVTSTLGTWYGGVVMGVLLSFNEAAILYRDFNSAPSQKQNIIVFAANNSRCCDCYVAPTIIL
jgi:hypothetical protein